MEIKLAERQRAGERLRVATPEMVFASDVSSNDLIGNRRLWKHYTHINTFPASTKSRSQPPLLFWPLRMFARVQEFVTRLTLNLGVLLCVCIFVLARMHCATLPFSFLSFFFQNPGGKNSTFPFPHWWSVRSRYPGLPNVCAARLNIQLLRNAVNARLSARTAGLFAGSVQRARRWDKWYAKRRVRWKTGCDPTLARAERASLGPRASARARATARTSIKRTSAHEWETIKNHSKKKQGTEKQWGKKNRTGRLVLVMREKKKWGCWCGESEGKCLDSWRGGCGRRRAS